MKNSKMEIKQVVRYEPVIDTVTVELPTEICYYFLGGIRKSYKIIPKFKDWEPGDDNLFKYDIIEVGLSFECVVTKFTVNINDIPEIIENHKHKAYHIVNHIIEYPDSKTRTKDQFDGDLNMAISQIKE